MLKKKQIFCIGILWEVFVSYLTNKVQFDKIDDTISTVQNVNSGVLRGSLSEALLFILYVNVLTATKPMLTVKSMMTTRQFSIYSKDFMTLQLHWESC